MNQDLILRAFAIADQEGVASAADITKKALAEWLGPDWSNVDVLQQLITEYVDGPLRREFRKTANDPDQIIEAEQMSMFPVPPRIIVVDSGGNEIYKSGRSATLEETNAHVTRVARMAQAKARKMDQIRNKSVALVAATNDSGDDPSELLYTEAIEKHGTVAIGMLRGEISQD